MTEFIKGLFGFGTAKLAPILVAGARAGAAAGVTAGGGLILVQLEALDWGEYAPYSLLIMGVIRFVIEGVGDQLKTGVEDKGNQ